MAPNRHRALSDTSSYEDGDGEAYPEQGAPKIHRDKQGCLTCRSVLAPIITEFAGFSIDS